MLNIEKYKDELIEMGIINIDKLGVKNGEPIICENHTTEICESCDIGKSSIECSEAIKDWLFSEYKEPEVDWSKVAVDTPILVKLDEGIVSINKWYKKHFARFVDGKIYAWKNGKTSWTALDENDVCSRKHAKLTEMENTECNHFCKLCGRPMRNNEVCVINVHLNMKSNNHKNKE